MLCCAVLCCAVLCCAVLCCAVLCCAVLCCAVLCCAVLCCAVLCCAVLYCTVLYSIVLYCQKGSCSGVKPFKSGPALEKNFKIRGLIWISGSEKSTLVGDIYPCSRHLAATPPPPLANCKTNAKKLNRFLLQVWFLICGSLLYLLDLIRWIALSPAGRT